MYSTNERCGSGNNYPGIKDDRPICIPCDGIGYKAPFRKEVPYKLTFVVQWYIEKVEQEKKFLLSYFDFDGTIELKDLDRQRAFLRRMRLDTVKLGELFVGNKLLVLARHMIILGYGDGLTGDYCEPKSQKALLMVQPEAMGNLPSIIQRLEKCFRIVRGKTGTQEKKSIAVFLVISENALEKMKQLVGEAVDPKEALMTSQTSLRALFGESASSNGFFYPETPESVAEEAIRFFSDSPSGNVMNDSFTDGRSTCCVIKPHIMREGRAGIVLADVIGHGFELAALGVFWLDRRQAEEFYEIYKRIYAEAEFMEMVDELSVGPCLAIELRSSFENTTQALRCICGPSDSDLARQVRPCSIRAKHGLNKIQNAIHCTDLPEDAFTELEYFFRILDRQAKGIKSVTGTF